MRRSEVFKANTLTLNFCFITQQVRVMWLVIGQAKKKTTGWSYTIKAIDVNNLLV